MLNSVAMQVLVPDLTLVIYFLMDFCCFYAPHPSSFHFLLVPVPIFSSGEPCPAQKSGLVLCTEPTYGSKDGHVIHALLIRVLHSSDHGGGVRNGH